MDKVSATRLGCCGRGFDDIKDHPFFRSINWTHLEAGVVEPPYKLDVSTYPHKTHSSITCNAVFCSLVQSSLC